MEGCSRHNKIGYAYSNLALWFYLLMWYSLIQLTVFLNCYVAFTKQTSYIYDAHS